MDYTPNVTGENRQIVSMTPSLAKALLNASPKLARQVSRLRVAAMADQMRHPDDLPTGERPVPVNGSVRYTIELDRDGHLVYGRHVLLAVILADRPVEMWLEDDCEPSRFTKYPPFDIRKAGA